jgi:outer membrane protein W
VRKLFRRLISASACAIFLLQGTEGYASDNSNAISFGAYSYEFNSSSNDLAGPYTPFGIRASEENVSAVALIYTRMLARDWSVTLALGVPPTYHLDGEGIARPLDQIATTKVLSPALIFQHHWHFLDQRLEPFIGLGVSYNHFYSLGASYTLESALGGPTSISVKDIWAPITTAGFNYNLTKTVFLTFATSYINMSANARLTTANTARTVSIKLNPLIYRFTVGARF